MDGFEEKLGSILGNPEMMQKIMTMAQSLGPATGEQPPETSPPAPQIKLPADLDLGMLQKLSGLTQQGSITKEQQNLLHALRPYLNRDRIHKLENAMRAAKMARIVAGVLGTAPHQSYR